MNAIDAIVIDSELVRRRVTGAPVCYVKHCLSESELLQRNEL